VRVERINLKLGGRIRRALHVSARRFALRRHLPDMETRLSTWAAGFGASALGGGCGRLGGWRPGLLCATRGQADIRGSGGPQDHGFVVGCRCLTSGVAGPRGGGRVAHREIAGSPRVAGPPPTQPTGWTLSAFSAHSTRVIAQQKPASSRATAMAMIVRRLALASSRVQVRCRRCWALHAIAIACVGWPS
jgi:hypothetical protein